MTEPQRQLDEVFQRPTVTVTLVEYDRLRGIEERALGCLSMINIHTQHNITKSEELARLDDYARQFVVHILQGGS
jgi:hypothetical protein